jgi:hypothetical protein
MSETLARQHNFLGSQVKEGLASSAADAAVAPAYSSDLRCVVAQWKIRCCWQSGAFYMLPVI